MDTRTIFLLVVVIGIVGIGAALLLSRRRRSEHLRSHFGPEYDRTVQMQGTPAKAEAVLAQREERVKKFSLRQLPPVDRERYASEWGAVQRQFVDDPSTAVTQADRLVTTV